MQAVQNSGIVCESFLNNILTIEEEDTEQSENEFAVTMSTFDILEFEHEFALQQVFY